MKFVAPLLCLGVANAFVLPDSKLFAQVALEEEHQQQHHGEPSIWDRLPSKEAIASIVKDAAESVSFDGILDAVDRASTSAKATLDELLDQEYALSFDDGEEHPHPPHRGPPHDGPPHDGPPHDGPPHDGPPHPPRKGRGGRHGRHPDRDFNLTIYELISQSKHATKFTKLVDEYDDIVQLLNSTEANYTVFVPVDEAFEHVPEDKKPSREFVEAVVRYHIGVGVYPVRRLLATHTLPTAYHESWLGGRPQRLRTSISLRGLHVNFYSKVIAPNFGAKNGILHAVNHILVPPPMVGKEISLFPSLFSTLLLAYEKTEFVKFIHGVELNGSTVFAPSNGAFAKLGVPANAFLFNTETGLRYLKALLKYQIVANATLYSDAYYGSGEDTDVGRGHHHLDLPTLLGDKSVAVDVARWAGFVRIRLNGYVRVVVQDGVAKNGVIQVVDSVPIPPHKHEDGEQSQVDGEISVEELKARLDGYLDEDDKVEQDGSSVEL